MPASISIKIQDLSKRFRESWLFQHLDHQFSPGERIAILGQNGSGKSTLLKILSGYMTQTEGSLLWTDQSDATLDTIHYNQHFAYCAPYQELIEEFTLRESIDFHFSLKSLRKEIDLDSWLNDLRLSGHENKPVGRFSSGMKQRLKLLLCLASEVDVYFLDEPCSNLDEKGVEWYARAVVGLPQKSLVFIASNSPKEYEICTTKIHLTE